MLVRLSQRIARCLERARLCREQASAAADLASQRDFSDLQDRWLGLAASYEFCQRMASRTDDLDAHRRDVRSIPNRAEGVRYVRNADAVACMTLAYNEIMKAVSLTRAEMPESIAVARLIVDLATQGERDPDRLCDSVLSLLNARNQSQP
jgi:hypothetical protein